MVKKEFIQALAERTGWALADAEKAFDGVLDIAFEMLEHGQEVTLPKFGKFEIRERKARQGRNLHTGETIEVPARAAVKFKPSSNLKEAVGKLPV